MPTSAAAAPAEALRVLVVDDSAVVRTLTSRWIEAEPDLALAGLCRNGREAVEQAGRLRPDVILLDVEMPDMDGITALPLLLKAAPDAMVLMASALTRRNAELSIRALALGASDVIAKPGQGVDQETYRLDLLSKVRALREHVRRRARRGSATPLVRAAVIAGSATAATAPRARPFSAAPVRALVLGASTGGPQALASLLSGLGPSLGAIPVLVTQHMPATFTAALAEHLGLASRRPCREATDGEPLAPGVIYVAPGGRHLVVARRGAQPCARLDDGPPENYCKPAVDPMFRSAASVYGAGLLAVVLTGMGSDGACGVRAVAAAGGSIIAQDEATSVVWGMPGAAVATGSCSAVLPLAAIAPKITRLVAGERA